MEISIIVPVHNEEKTIALCLDHLVNQEFPQNQFEIYVVDDGSSDNTSDIVKKYATRYQNIRPLNKQQGGKGSAVNYALNEIRSKYVSVVDSDSLVAPNYLTEVVNAFNKNDQLSIVLVYSNYIQNDLLGKIVTVNRTAIMFYSWYKYFPMGTGTSFRTTVLKAVNGYDIYTTSTTGVTVNKVLRLQPAFVILDNTQINLIDKLTLSGYFKQKLRWREAILDIGFEWDIKSLTDTFYVYGLSLFLLFSLLLLIGSLAFGQLSRLFLMLVFVAPCIDTIRYLRAILLMRSNSLLLCLSILIDQMIRIALIPYLVYRFIKPRKKPVFTVQR